MEKEILIKKWLQGELSREEKTAFDALEDASFMEEITLEARRFSGAQMAPAPSFEALESRLAEKPAKKGFSLSFMIRIAAVFVLGLGLFYVLNASREVNLRTGLAGSTSHTLPDNSEVTLNERTTIVYKPGNWEQSRVLTLDGEAFFEVEKGSRFDVETAGGTVSVLGTEFNVKARDSVFQIVCYEGLVQVTAGGQVTQIPAGNALDIRDGKFLKEQVALKKPQWVDQLSVFENAPLAAVIAELEKQYGINIINESAKELMFTGAFENDNLENALAAIAQTLGLTYEINGKQVRIKDEIR
jgi:ferric-dicitrate binding protein FerR (iron transport regulator)